MGQRAAAPFFPERVALGGASFAQDVVLFPLAYGLHVLEEWPLFPLWAREHGAPAYTDAAYLRLHLLGLAAAVACAALFQRTARRGVVFLFFALLFAPSVPMNAAFHVGATLVSGEYCPGVVTALVVYPAVFLQVLRSARAQGLLSARGAALALGVAAPLHAWEVGHAVYGLW